MPRSRMPSARRSSTPRETSVKLVVRLAENLFARVQRSGEPVERCSPVVLGSTEIVVAARKQHPYPRRSLEQALRVPGALRDHNGGQPWRVSEVANALGLGA